MQAELRSVEAALQSTEARYIKQSHQLESMQAELRSVEVALQSAEARYNSIANSTIWRVSGVLCSTLDRFLLGVRHRTRQALKLVYWTMTLQLPQRLREHLAMRQQTARASDISRTESRVRGSALLDLPPTDFDAAYYLRENPDVAAAGIDPLVHYLSSGRKEGRFPGAVAASGTGRFTLASLCKPQADESGPRISDDELKISVLTPTYNTEPRYLWELFYTLRNQQYSNWEWVVVDDGSQNVNTIVALREIRARDPRMRLTLNAENLGISEATNAALAAAQGTHVALVDHDDLLARDAFFRIYEAWKSNRPTQIFYTDECKLQPDGTLTQFWPKPDWSPAYLENTMCLGHLSVYEAEFIRSLGGFRSEYNGTQDFDLALRAVLAKPKVVHISSFAYLWRIIPGSAAFDLNEKSYAVERQHKAVQDYARHRHPEAVVAPGWGAGYWRIRYPLPSPAPLLSYVIPTGGGLRIVREQSTDLVLNCIRSFDAQCFYPNREYIVIHNGDLTSEQVRNLTAIEGVRLVRYDSPSFNLSEKLNLGVSAANGEYVCLLNDDVEAITERGGEQLVGYLAVNSAVGAIGPMCLFEDGTIQQNGLVLTAFGPAHAGAGQPADFGGHQAMMRCRREAFGIGGAIMFMKKRVYVQCGGFDEALPLNYNDVDFCLRLRESGLSCVVDPGIQVYHYEGATKIGTSAVEQERLFLKHPGISDPYFSPWFKQDSVTYQIDLHEQQIRWSFGSWLDRHIAGRATKLKLTARPRFSICVSVYNQPKKLLEEMYNSVVMQTYDNKEFIILNNGSSNPETLEWLSRVQREGRATFVHVERNLGIDGGNRKLLDTMTGDFFVAMDADDFLSVDALQVMADAVGHNPGKKVFYSDEYKSDMASIRFSPFFKPDFDPLLLMNCCYPAHLMVMDASFLRQIDAYSNSEAAWCHDYDTLTRALAVGEEPIHVRELIYAWRINPGSTASAPTSGKPETVDSQLFVMNRYLHARGLSDVLSLEPNNFETSRGMWHLRAARPVPGIRFIEAEEVWGGCGLAGLLTCAENPNVTWIAILASGDRETAALELSAPAWLDPRIVAVGGLLMNPDNSVCWSGGLFLPGGRVFDPYNGQPFATGGYHGQLWSQRCVDVVAPVNVLIRVDALRRAAERPGVRDPDSLMTMLGVEAQERGTFIAVTPHLRAQASRQAAVCMPLDRGGLLLDLPALALGSRWYNGCLEVERPYVMPYMA